MMRILSCLTVLAAFLALTPAVLAQGNAPIDKTYESSKSAELESVKLQMVTRQGSRGLSELTEAESALRRLQKAKAPDLRAKIATELDSALARLHLAVEGDRTGK
jgi:hypothetical protein